MIIVEHIKAPSESLAGLERDVVALTWEERRKSRQKATTRNGLELGLALPTGSLLKPGDILYKGKGCYVAVEAALEDVLVIHPGDGVSAALIAYEIGNLHRPIAIDEDALMTPFDHHLEHKLQAMGVACERRRTPFEPIRKSHSHG